jgi:hypothetical protein
MSVGQALMVLNVGLDRPFVPKHKQEDINRAWENITENIKISAKDSLGLYE